MMRLLAVKATLVFAASAAAVVVSPRAAQAAFVSRNAAGGRKRPWNYCCVLRHQERATSASTRLLSSSSSSSSSTETTTADATVEIRADNDRATTSGQQQKKLRSSVSDSLASAEVKARLDAQLAKLRLKDSTSKKLTKEDVVVVYEDEHIVVVNKPTGVLTVSTDDDKFPNLARAVYDYCCAASTESSREKNKLVSDADRMVVHRLGMDTSGLICFAKTLEAVRGMNTVFRTRNIERKYEALVCGHVEKDEGLINLPLMRDYEYPPYVRVSTDEHQRALLDLDPDIVGKKLLEQPKESVTKYQVVSREEVDGHPVTRVVLTSISGRYHQLNCHLAAFGHPIVGDGTYGIDGVAAPDGGLSESELEEMAHNPARADPDLQKALSSVGVNGNAPCVHATSLKFRHPVIFSGDISISADAPF